MFDDDILQKYCNVADTYDLLTSKREKELALTIRKYKGGKLKQQAREELINHNLKLVIKLAFYFYKKEKLYSNGQERSELTIMDLIGAGNIGLTRAVDLYNPKKFKTRFSTYAVPWIKQGITSLLCSHNSVIHVPAHIIAGSQKYKNIEKKDKGGQLSDKDMMNILEVSEKGLKNLKKSKIKSFSMDASVKNGQKSSGDESNKTLRDFIPDIKQNSPFEMTAKNDTSDIIEKALKELDPVSRDVIEGQYLNPNKVNLRDLGKKHKLSGERIRQIKEIALDKMKWKLKRKTSSKANPTSINQRDI